MRFSRVTRALTQHPLRLGVAAIVAAAIPLGLATTAPAAAAKPARPKPTVVLVHGAWADGSSWSGVVRRLQQDGYPVDVAPNPLRGLASDTAYLKDYLSTIHGPVILAGHSYGGSVITDAATGNPNVKALVYVDAFVPAAGESSFQLIGAGSAVAGAGTDPTSLFNLVPFPGAATGDADAYLLPNVFLTSAANDLPKAQAEQLEASQTPIAASAVNEPSTTPAWQTIPSYDLIGTDDKLITPAEQEFMANRAKAQTVKVKAGHLSLISQPGAVANLIVRAADDRG